MGFFSRQKIPRHVIISVSHINPTLSKIPISYPAGPTHPTRLDTIRTVRWAARHGEEEEEDGFDWNVFDRTYPNFKVHAT